MEGIKRFLKAEYWAEALTWIIILLIIVFRQYTPVKAADDEALLMYAGFVLAFALFYYYVLYKVLPFAKRHWIKSIGDVILIGILIFLARDYGINLITLLFMPIAASMFILGFVNSLLIAIFAVVIVALDLTIHQGNLTTFASDPHSTLWPIISLVITIIYTRTLARHAHQEKILKQEAENKLEEVKKKMEEYESMQKEFVSLTAHQLFTPLSVIRGFASNLLEGDAGKLTTKQRQYLEETHLYTIRMVRLVKELLNISRIEGGHYKIQVKPMDILETLQDLIEELTPVAAAKSITLELDLPPGDLPHVLADKTKVPEVILNLMDNAIKYSPANSKVELSIRLVHRDKQTLVQVDVKDHGVGIPEDEQQYVFQRFFRATNILSMDSQGTGLGLFIAKRLIELQGGNITFISKTSEGTTFSIILPAHMIDTPPEKETSKKSWRERRHTAIH